MVYLAFESYEYLDKHTFRPYSSYYSKHIQNRRPFLNLDRSNTNLFFKISVFKQFKFSNDRYDKKSSGKQSTNHRGNEDDRKTDPYKFSQDFLYFQLVYVSDPILAS